jgi:putative transposase
VADREAMSFLATTSGITGEDIRDLMVGAVEHRFERRLAKYATKTL